MKNKINILSEIEKLKLNYVSEYNEIPNYLFLGKDEFFELVNYCHMKHCFTSFIQQIHKNEFYGMQIILVNEKSFILVAK